MSTRERFADHKGINDLTVGIQEALTQTITAAEG